MVGKREELEDLVDSAEKKDYAFGTTRGHGKQGGGGPAGKEGTWGGLGKA